MKYYTITTNPLLTIDSYMIYTDMIYTECKFLIDGENVKQTDINGDTPLHLATEIGCVDIVELLLINGANVNQLNNTGIPPCMLPTNKNIKETLFLWSIGQHPIQLKSKIVRKELPLILHVHVPEIVDLVCGYIHV